VTAAETETEAQRPCYAPSGFHAPEVVKAEQVLCASSHPGRPCTPAPAVEQDAAPLPRVMTWRDLLMEVTDALRHAPPEALDRPVMVQLPGRRAPLFNVAYEPDDSGMLVVEPWLAEPDGRW
jgi:hypothetical protein